MVERKWGRKAKKRGRKAQPVLFVEKHELDKLWDKLPAGMDTQIKPDGEDVEIRGKHLESMVAYLRANKRRKHTPNKVIEYLHETNGISRNQARRVVATAINTGLVHTA